MLNLKSTHLVLMLASCMSTWTIAGVIPDHQKNNAWFADGHSAITTKIELTKKEQTKNVILFVGDGMGITTLTAARIFEGQAMGKHGEEHILSFEAFPHTALVKTYNVDAQTPDSAGTMTAMVSGLKTDVGVIGVDEDVERGNCKSSKGNEVATLLEMAEIKGLSTGIVTTARITHATPAALYAKSANRNWEDNSDIPEDEIAAGCEDIASQLVNFEANLVSRIPGATTDGIEVVFGGGRRHFLPKDAVYNTDDAISDKEGDRTDGRHLINEWQTRYPEGQYVYRESDFNTLQLDKTPVLGLFNESHMRYEANRAEDAAGEPSLSSMTKKAIDLLKTNDKGFFLTVESGRIDHGHHAGSAYNALTDAVEFAKAVEAAVESTNPDETLIIVTADHSHVFTIAGYPKRGNPILGKVVTVGSNSPAMANDNMPYTTLGYTNGRGFKDLGPVTDADLAYTEPNHNHRVDLTDINTESTGFHQEALVPLISETHSGEDISVHARGPNAHLVQGVIEQNVIYHIINNSLNLMAK